MQAVTDFSNEYVFGYTFNALVAGEASVRQGHNYVQSALSQTFLVATTAGRSFKLLEACGNSVSNPGWTTLIVSVIPLGVSYLASKDELPWFVTRSVYLIFDHTSDLCFVVSTVSSIALFALSPSVITATSLVMITAGVLDRSGYLPTSVQKTMRQSNFIFGNGLSLIFGGYLEKSFAVLSVSAYAIEFFVGSLSSVVCTDSSFEDIPIVVPSVAEVANENLVFCAVRKKHIHEGVSIPTPNIEILKLKELALKITWNESNLSALKRKLEGDERWKKRDSEKDPKTYFIDQFNKSIDEIAKQKVLIGQIRDYRELERYLKHITAHVEDCFESRKDIEATDILFRLGVEGGDYCGPGRYEVAEDIYHRLFENVENKEIPLEALVKQHLQGLRRDIFRKIYANFFENTPFMGLLFDPQDVHIYNIYARALDPIFKIGARGAANDETVDSTPLDSLLFQLAMEEFRGKFWCEYEDKLIDEVQKMSGTTRLPLPDVYCWWDEWAQKLPDGPEKTKLLALLDDGKISHQVGGKLELKRTYTVLMLKIMGVLC